MTLYRTKPSQVEAVMLDAQDAVEAEAFCTHGTFCKLRLRHGRWELLAGRDGAQGWVHVPPDHLIVRNPGDPTDLWHVAGNYFDRKYEVEDA